MKVIFLDHDGVICLSTEWGSRDKKRKKANQVTTPMSELPVDLKFDNFNKKAVDVLNDILRKTDAEVIISSDWRTHCTLDEMGQYYHNQGILKRPIAFTPNKAECTWYKEIDFPWDKTSDLEQDRTIEITQFIIDNKQITNWVAVDDLNMGVEINTKYGKEKRDWGLSNFTWTPRCDEGIKQLGIKEKIISFLNS